MSDKSEGLLFHAKRWNTSHSSTHDLEEAAIAFARTVGPVGEQDNLDIQRCVNFRINELTYALEPRNARYLESLRLTRGEAWAETERLVSLRGRLERGG